MHSQIALLTIVTGLFAAAWTSDNPSGQTVVAVNQPRIAAPPESRTVIEHGDRVIRQARRAGSETVRSQPAIVVPRDDAARFRTTHAVNSLRGRSFDLPPDITAGRFRVVDNRGETCSIVVTPDDVANLGIAIPLADRELYIVNDGDVRRYFIRVRESGGNSSNDSAAARQAKNSNYVERIGASHR